MCPIKEPRFFAYDGSLPEVNGPDTSVWLLSCVLELGAYQRLFDGVRDERAIGEASIQYLSYPGCPERYPINLPRVRIIVLLRDPADPPRTHNSSFLLVTGSSRSATSSPRSTPSRAEFATGGRRASNMPSTVSTTNTCHVTTRPSTASRSASTSTKTSSATRRVCSAICTRSSGRAPTSRRTLPDGTTRRASRRAASCSGSIDACGGPAREGALRAVTRRTPRTHASCRSRARRSLLQMDPQSAPRMPDEARVRLKSFFREDTLRLQDLIGRDLSHWL